VCPPEFDPDEVPPLGGNATVPRPTVEIRLEGGHLLFREVDCFPTNSLHPVARNALEAKFRDCVSFAPKNIDVAVVLIDDPENVADVAEITRLLGPELAT
jgi:hypothetical protein